MYKYANIVKYTIGLPILITITVLVWLCKIVVVYIWIGLIGFIVLSLITIIDETWAITFHAYNIGFNEYITDIWRPNSKEA